ncbi:uncharacterized protein [Dermacentor albipictus]|uniref:uncharacterized protein n=1 Tax=Dermacentor albipictus TaxID=60249 RepID=UPI0031FC0FAD
MRYSRGAAVRYPRSSTSARSALEQPLGHVPLIDLGGPVQFDRAGFYPPRSPSFGREPSPGPSYTFVAASKSEPQFTVVSFESSHKPSSTDSPPETSQSAERSLVPGGPGPSGALAAAATPGADGQPLSLPSTMIALCVFCLVTASAIAITVLVQETLARRRAGDEGHEGTGTDPPLRLQTGPPMEADRAGFEMHFSHRRRTVAAAMSPKQPPFLIVTLRPRTTTPSPEWPLTWPPFPETLPPWEEDESEDKKSSSEASSDGVTVSTVAATSAASVVLAQQQLTDGVDETTPDS